MATVASRGIQEFVFEWEGKDRGGKQVRGEIRASGENQVKMGMTSLEEVLGCTNV